MLESENRNRVIYAILVAILILIPNVIHPKIIPPGVSPPKDKVLFAGQTISLAAVGDIIMHLPVKMAARDQGGYSNLFGNICEYLKNHDLVFANLETTLSAKDSKKRFEWPGFFSVETPFLEDLKGLGFNILNLANNHTLDFGNQGFHFTLSKFLENKDITPLGYQNHPRRPPGTIIKIKGVSIGLMGYTLLMNLPHSIKELYPRVNYIQNLAEINEMITDIKNFSKRCDLLIISMHWGDEYYQKANPYITHLIEKISHAGADIILGHHPHVLQKVLTINKPNNRDSPGKTLVFQSLGNFISNQGAGSETDKDLSKRESAIFYVNVIMKWYQDDKGKTHISREFKWNYLPLWTQNILEESNSQYILKSKRIPRKIRPVVLPCLYRTIKKKINKARPGKISRKEAFKLINNFYNLRARLDSIISLLGDKNLYHLTCKE